MTSKLFREYFSDAVEELEEKKIDISNDNNNINDNEIINKNRDIILKEKHNIKNNNNELNRESINFSDENIKVFKLHYFQ